MTSTPQTVSRLGRERRRQLIQQFQNEVAEDDPMNPDSKSFDAKKYFKDLLRSKALPDLMKVDSELAKEIKILDGNVKTLVYDNYSKFITAADTIKKMKGNVENMEEEMSKLKVNIEKISQASTQITETLASKREKIEQLSGQHRLLQKLQFLVELPQNLEQAIKLEAYSEAVRRWVRTDPILVKYSQIQSFKNIYSTCIAIVERLRGLLKDKLAQKETSSEDLAEYVGLLIDLKESPATLRTDYLENRRQVLVSKLETFKDYQFLSATKPSSEASTLLETAVESQPQNSPSETDDNPAVYSRDVLQSLASDEQNEYSNFVKDISRTFFPTFIGFAVSFEQLFIKKEKAAAERANAASMFNTTSRHHLFSYYFDIVRSQLLRADSAVKVLGALQTQANSFGRVEEELDMLHFGRESDTLNISLNELSYNLIQSVLNSYLEQEFNSLQKRIEQLLSGVTRATDATKVNEPGYLSEIVLRSVNQIRSDIDALLLKFKPFFVVTKKGYFLEKHCTGFVAKIGIKMQQLFLYTTSVVLSKFVEMEGKDEQHVRGLLLLSKICLELRKTLPQIQTSLAMLLQLTDQTRLDFGVNVQDLAATLYEPAQRLLGQFVRLSGQQLGLMLHRAIDSGNWLKRREPQAVEMVIDLVVDELAALHRLVGRLFDDDLRNKVRRDNRRLRQQSATADIDQLFSRRVQYFGSVELYQSNILAAIIKICLKNMLESVRMRTFSTHGYQQIQVDTHFMRLALADYVDDETLLDVVLDQVLAGTADRTLDPQHLDLSVVNKICEDLLRKRRERTSATPTSTQ